MPTDPKLSRDERRSIWRQGPVVDEESFKAYGNRKALATFANRADAEGWDSRTFLIEAAKRGLSEDPNVQQMYQMKAEQEATLRDRGGVSQLLSGMSGRQVSDQGGVAQMVGGGDPVANAAAQLVASKQGGAMAGMPTVSRGQPFTVGETLPAGQGGTGLNTAQTQKPNIFNTVNFDEMRKMGKKGARQAARLEATAMFDAYENPVLKKQIDDYFNTLDDLDAQEAAQAERQSTSQALKEKQDADRMAKLQMNISDNETKLQAARIRASAAPKPKSGQGESDLFKAMNVEISARQKASSALSALISNTKSIPEIAKELGVEPTVDAINAGVTNMLSVADKAKSITDALMENKGYTEKPQTPATTSSKKPKVKKVIRDANGNLTVQE